MSAVREDLEKIRALVDEPTKWCQRMSRQGPRRRCAFQACVDVLGDRVTTTEAYGVLTKTAGMGVATFNDFHTHD